MGLYSWTSIRNKLKNGPDLNNEQMRSFSFFIINWLGHFIFFIINWVISNFSFCAQYFRFLTYQTKKPQKPTITFYFPSSHHSWIHPWRLPLALCRFVFVRCGRWWQRKASPHLPHPFLLVWNEALGRRSVGFNHRRNLLERAEPARCHPYETVAHNRRPAELLPSIRNTSKRHRV